MLPIPILKASLPVTGKDSNLCESKCGYNGEQVNGKSDAIMVEPTKEETQDVRRQEICQKRIVPAAHISSFAQ